MNKMNRVTKQNLITYAIVIVAYLIVMLLGLTGHISSLMEGLLVPLCIYVILAVSLNLVVGILGELSLGHAGFMCVGAFAGAFFSMCTKEAMPAGLRFLLALVIGGVVSLFASGYPDGLEWSMEKVAGTTELTASGGVYQIAEKLQSMTAFLPDYAFKASDSAAGTSVSGIAGGIVVLAVCFGVCVLIKKVKRTEG